MGEIHFIPSKTFPRDLRDLLRLAWDPRIALRRDMVKLESQRFLRPDYDPDAGRLAEALDPDMGQTIDRRI